MKPTRYASCNYKRLFPLIEGLTWNGGARRRFTAPGFMPLVVELLYTDRKGREIYSLTHYGEQNGDLMRDPDMELAVDHEAGTVEPLTFRNDYLGTFQEVYIKRNGQRLYSPRLRNSLDDFLRQWLKNIEMQQYKRESGTA